VSLSIDDVQEFLSAYPRMALRPVGTVASFEGNFDFTAAPSGGPVVTDRYVLRIVVPEYPAALPQVFETAGRIPRNIDDHVYPQTGSLCLGSYLRLRVKIGAKLNILRFADECVVPFLYATTRRQTDGSFVFGELPHGTQGLFQDYQDIFGVSDEGGVLATLRILAAKPSAADRHPCPCGCGRRHALCQFRYRVNEIRRIAPRKYFRDLYQAMRTKSPREKE
jgi:hypothetical protein